MSYCPVAGIDVSKRFSDMCILSPDNKIFAQEKIYHDETSINRANALLQKAERLFFSKPVIVMESTSHYHLILFQFFSEHGYDVIVVNKVTIMSNILKSTKLDIALVKPYFKTICFTLLLPIVFAAINRSLLTGVSFAMCFIAMTTGYTFSITEKNSMDRLFGILPVRKSELVIGRYVFVLAMGLLSLIISLIAQPLVLKVLGETVGVFDIVTAAIAGVFLFALYTVFQIPGYYKYGSIKGRVFMYIPVAGFLVTLLLLSKMPAIGNSIISVVESSPILLVFLAVFAIVVMYAVSIFLSIRIMKNKEM